MAGISRIQRGLLSSTLPCFQGLLGQPSVRFLVILARLVSIQDCALASFFVTVPILGPLSQCPVILQEIVRTILNVEGGSLPSSHSFSIALSPEPNSPSTSTSSPF